MSTPSTMPDRTDWGRPIPADAIGWNGQRLIRAASNGDRSGLPRALGWFSLGFGLAALIAPRTVARAVGIRNGGANQVLLRAIGLREVVSGVGLLTQPNPSRWLWARIGGDALDLAMLTKALTANDADRGRVAAATAAVVGVTAADALASVQTGGSQAPSRLETASAAPRETRIASAITINAPVARVYEVWDGFQGLPRFMSSLATVEVVDDRRSRWTASLPGGISATWDVDITDAVPNERIAWRSREGSRLDASGDVRFRPAPGDRGTEVLFEARFRPPGGEWGSRIAGLASDPLGQKVQNDLRRAKQLVELGEIVHSDDSIVKGPNPAQPVDAIGPA